MKTKQYWLVYCYIFTISVAIVTQFPYVNKSVLSLINYGVWGMLAGCIVISSRELRVSSFFYLIVSIWFVTYLTRMVLNFFSIETGIGGLVNILIIPMFVYCASLQITRYLNGNSTITFIVFTYCVMTFLLALQILPQMLTGYSDWMTSEVYLYDGATHKNSTAQVLGCGFLAALFYFKEGTYWKKYLRWGILAIYIIALAFVQSRSVLIALLISVFVLIIFETDKRKKYFQLGVLGITVVIVKSSDKIVNLISHLFMIDKYANSTGLDMESFSSGRLIHWKTAWNKFCEHPFWGTQLSSCDNFFLNALGSCGIIIGTAFILIWLLRITKNIVLVKKNNGKEYNLLMALTIFYFIISLFEAYPPFGPGVSTMFLWILCGYVDGQEKNKFINGEN